MQIIDSRANSGYHDVCKTETFFQLLTRLFVERHDLRRLGKDEVGSSNLPISSNIKHSNLAVWVLFVLLLQLLR